MPDTKRTATGVLGGLLGLVGLSAIAGVLVTATVTPAVAVSSAAASSAITLFDNLPSVLNISKLMLPTTIYTKNPDTGKYEVMTSFYDQNRIPVTWDQINPVMYDAILSSEDPRFYQHGGIDPIGTTRALLSNLKGDANIQGGSSISQQYVKNVLVQQCYLDANQEKTAVKQQAAIQKCYAEAISSKGTSGISRKLQEMRYAIALEQKYSKNDILLGYLNIANFGGQTYGIEAAAEYYFGVKAKDLNYEQAATLAGMVQNPNLYRLDMPGGTTTVKGKAVNGTADGFSLTKKRETYVLDRMKTDGKITEAQYEQGLKDPIVPSIHTPTTGCANTAAPYFCAYVVSVVQDDPAFGKTAADRQNALRQGGLNIYTTLDWRLQNVAQQTINRYTPATVNQSSWTYGAVIVNIENSTGRVLSMVQNTNFTNDANPPSGSTAIIYAGDVTHGQSAGFAPGSTFKLFTLLDWLEQGHSVNERVNGTIRPIKRLTNSCDGDWVNYGNVVLKNFNNEAGYYGTPMQFTAVSLNSGFFGMAEKLDIGNDATKLGVVNANDMTPIQMKTQTAIIGNAMTVSPLSLAGAYSAVANNGMYCPPHVIDRVTDSTGKDITLSTPACSQQVQPNVAATAAYALQGVMHGNGTGVLANPNDGTQLMGKTGTNESNQVWAVEASTAVTSLVWSGVATGVGGANGLENPRANIWKTYYRGSSLSNVRYAMAKITQGTADKYYHGGRFPAPDPTLNKQVMVNLPNVVGMTQAQATQTLQAAGFAVTVGAAVDSTAPAGTIAAQSPAAGQVNGATPVTISPSNGQGILIPDVSGKSAVDAVAALRAAGVGDISGGPPCQGPGAKAASTTPAAGTIGDANTSITVTCSGGH
jgi:membrane peptidoglycan carboxypeptidase